MGEIGGTGQAYTSLVVPEPGARGPAGRRPSILTPCDLSLVLDALAQRLGAGLEGGADRSPDADEADPLGSEEELVGTEDDALVPSRRPPGSDELRRAALMESKLLVIVKRLGGQLERAQEERGLARDEAALRATVQVAAVLEFIRELLASDVRSAGRGTRMPLVGPKVVRELQSTLLKGYFYGPAALMRAAARVVEDEGSEELSQSVGLSAWLLLGREGAHRTTTKGEEAAEVRKRAFRERAEALYLLGLVAEDPRAEYLADQALSTTTPAAALDGAMARWRGQLDGVRRLQQALRDPPIGSLEEGLPQVGDLVYLWRAPAPRLHVVTRVEQTHAGFKIGILVPDEHAQDKDCAVLPAFLAVLPRGWSGG